MSKRKKESLCLVVIAVGFFGLGFLVRGQLMKLGGGSKIAERKGKIAVYNRENDEFLGQIAVENGELDLFAYRPEIEQYWESQVQEWKGMEFEYLIGGADEEGSKRTRWGEDDFLVGLFSYLEENVKQEVFGNKYYFVLD